MRNDSLMTRLIRRALALGASLGCVGLSLWLAYMGWSWYLAFAAGAAAGSLVMLMARTQRDWPDA